MLGQLFQGIITGLSNHFEIPGLLPAEDGADTTKEIADDIAGSDTGAIDRPDDADHTHAGTVADGEDKDRTLFCGHAVSLSAEYCNPCTEPAEELAKEDRIILVDGKHFIELIERLPASSQARLLAFATEGDYTTP